MNGPDIAPPTVMDWKAYRPGGGRAGTATVYIELEVAIATLSHDD
jgi:hypothetical protein